MKIIVTAALGIVGRGIINSIRISNSFKESYIVGIDILTNRYGSKTASVNKLIKSPYYSEKCFIDFFLELVAKEKPDAIIVTNELELTALCNENVKPALIPASEFVGVAISKQRLFESLKNTDLVPKFTNYSREELLRNFDKLEIKNNVWIRDASAGSSGGKGAFYSNNIEEIKKWIVDNTELEEIQISEFLPGRNLGCTMLFKDGQLYSAVCAERLSYLLGDLTKSGVTGMANKGLIFYNQDIINTCISAIKKGPGMNNLSGVVTIDLKEDKNKNIKITEFNLRYIGLVFPFALAGFNVVENHIQCIINNPISEFDTEAVYEFYRSIDGPPEVYKI